MKIGSLVAGICFVLSAVAIAQEALTNDSIEKMSQARLGDDVIVAMIQSQVGHYEVTPDTLITLKREGVSDKVLAAMAAKGNASPAASPASTAPAMASPAVVADPYEDLDVGIYRKYGNNWVQIPTEQVNWKTGGVLKSTASVGLVKGDINGRLKGSASSTQMNTPLQFIVKAPDGLQGTDFQLVHLHEKGDAREFRTITGGVLHASGGSSRDEIRFEETRIAKRTYRLTLPGDLARGEYAFLAPGSSGSSATGSTGRAYTFRLVE